MLFTDGRHHSRRAATEVHGSAVMDQAATSLMDKDVLEPLAARDLE
jgi:hypothetical protein